MARFRKKPVEIEADRWDGTKEDGERLVAWANPYGVKFNLIGLRQKAPDPIEWVLNIPTLEGTMFVNPGDYIIKGVQDEFYPCKPTIFEVTYDRVQEPLPPVLGGGSPEHPYVRSIN